MIPTVRVADTPTILSMNELSKEHGHEFIFDDDLLARLDPDGLHVCWGVFPHEADPTNLTLLEAGKKGPSVESIAFANGNLPDNPPQDDPHLRSAWLLSVTGSDCPVEEAILHLLHWDQLDALPIYARPSDRNYPPTD